MQTADPAEGAIIDMGSPETPEARHHRMQKARAALGREVSRVKPGSHSIEVVKRVLVGVYTDGFIHAGNLAYLTLLTLFPFFIVTAAVASLFGQSQDGLRTVASFLQTLPPDVAELLRKPILDVLAARTGSLLWLGAIVGLWTVGSFIETIRDILRRAYGTPYSHPFWRYRLGTTGLIIGAVVLAMLSFTAQVALTAAEQFIYRLLPFAEGVAGLVGLSRLVPAFLMFGALYAIIYTLTPSKYRDSNCPKWPGALFTTLWWLGTTALLPKVLSLLGGYDLTYGSLAGVIIALFFFWIIGFGLVIAAHLNAALAETPDASVRETAPAR